MKKWPLITHISLFIIFTIFIFLNTFETLDYRLQDILYQQSKNISSEIVIVGIDDESLEELGRWPWSRNYHGELINLINEGKPAVIGYDVIFSEESTMEEDNYLIRNVETVENIVFPVYGTFNKISKRGIIQANNITRPFVELDRVASTAHINTTMDNDGIVRKTIINFQYEGDKVNSFAWEIYKLYKEKIYGDKVRMEDIPLDPWERIFIRFSGEPSSFEIISFYKVLNGEVSGEYFRDKIVLIGPTAIGMADDYYFTPLAPQIPMYGVEIHGNIIQQLINNQYWKEISLIGQVSIMLILSIIAYVLLRRFKPEMGILVLLGIAGVFVILIRGMSLGNKGYVMSFIYPLGLLGVQYILILGENFIVEKLGKQRVISIFGKYVAPQIVDKILEEGEEDLQLGGVRRETSILFVDIRGFTSLSESMEPEEVVSILNDYLGLCAESIFKYGGTLDKYIGDAAMAIYNAPLDLKNHQLKAVQSAWAMKQGARALEEKLKEEFGKTVEFGIGIHSGNTIVGNIGADFRMDYTAIGDTVNTAARIESNSKPGQILISQEVYNHVKDYVKVSDLGEIKVKGKKELLQIYEIENLKIQ